MIVTDYIKTNPVANIKNCNWIYNKDTQLSLTLKQRVFNMIFQYSKQMPLCQGQESPRPWREAVRG